MIKLFGANETNFKHCKWVLSEVLSVYITETTEGNFELDLEYPLFDSKNLSRYLIRGNIISCECYDNRPDQLFKIRKANKSTENKVITVYAEAIGRADADNNYIPGLEIPKGKTRREALQIVLNNRADKRRNYTIGSLDTSTNTNVNLGLDDNGNIINYVDIADKSLLKAILEESTDSTNSSIYTAYKGEVIWNNFEINMVDERGKDNSFIIKSGKNLESLEEEISDMDDNFATALVMKSSDGLFLPNQEIIYSPNANKYDRYFYKTIPCDDVSLEDLITENSSDKDIEEAKKVVYEQLRERAAKQFANGIDKPPTNYTVNFIQLADTEEYKDYAKLKKCELGNNVTTIYSKIGVRSEGRIIRIKYNVLTKKIEEVEIGDRLKKSIVDNINNTENKVDNVEDKVNDNKNDLKKTKVTMEKYNNSIVLKVENLSKDTMAKIEVLEKEIVAKVSEEEMWSLIKLNPGKILLAVNDEKNRTDVIIDTDGLTVENGKFKIFDEDSRQVFGVSKAGTVKIAKILKVETKSDLTAELDGFGLIFESGNKSAGIEFNYEKGDLDITTDRYLRINGEKLEDVIRAVLKNEGLI
ncbi:phage tail protein [Clostridium botulinum]|uniref:phage tail protein n=1 Tax=Clostridium botulinum TaxID=1491 RepID=UPI0001AAD697|nr:phage tail protein [Clostridium botulinum]EES49217.1 phage minor structural protein [Clostridium botulinum E1 str. 'BoNT E Beluga']MBY6760074.1 phage tail protein [Clostridium botulinum]MBY6918983.1 phage tail protein [Clostridium botulinum]MCR1132630.1 phage tail protein [Clostridium botulinum]HBZ6634882.1 phage tail protein [Clostridium botulinum]